jgi:DNA-binding CsgD family transcriptional regulator
MESILKNEDLSALSESDIVDVFNIIHLANCHSGLSDVRKKVAAYIKQSFRANGVVFFLGDKDFKKIDNTSLIAANADFRYLERWSRYYCHHDPFQGEAHTGTAVCKVDDILPYRKWVNLKIYNEFYLPQNIHYKLSISLATKEKTLGLIGIFRPRGYQDFSTREVAKARILVPHLTTALENASVTRTNREGRPGAEELDGNASLFGVIVLDHDLHPVHWNSEAREFCSVLARREQHERNEDTEDTFLSEEIMSDCLALKGLFDEGERDRPFRSQRIIEARDGRRIRVISSLEKLSIRGASGPKFLIYLADVSEGYRLREDSLRERYQLTKREADIALCVCEGLTNDEIGEKLFISRFTVETHLKNIFSKTNVKHRAGLAGLLQSP